MMPFSWPPLLIAVAVVLLAVVIIRQALQSVRPATPLISTLLAAGIRPRECDHLLSRGYYWQSRAALMTAHEVHFMQGLFRVVDMNRWYVCPQVRVADIIELSPHIRPRTRMWWTLFNMIAKWHCDVVIVDRKTFEIVAAIELDDASHLRKDRVRRDILLNEVMDQAQVPLLRHRNARTLLDNVQQFLAGKCATTAPVTPATQPARPPDLR